MPERPRSKTGGGNRRSPGKRKKQASNLGLVWGLIGVGAVLTGAVVLVLALTGGSKKENDPKDRASKRESTKPGTRPNPNPNPGPGSPQLTPERIQQRLVGRWESTDGKKSLQNFRADGTMTSMMGQAGFTGTYQVLDAGTLRMDLFIDKTKLKFIYTMQNFTQDQITLLSEDRQQITTYKRIEADP